MLRHLPNLLTTIALLAPLTSVLETARADELLSGGSLQSLMKPPKAQPPSKQPPKASVPGAISKKDLRQFLIAAGHQPKDLGNDAYEIKVLSTKWTFPIRVSMATNESLIWLQLRLPKLDLEKGLRAEKLLGILAENFRNSVRYGPYHFEYDAQGNSLCLSCPVANRGMTPDIFRSYVRSFAQRALEAEPLWDPAQLGEPAPKIVGAWSARKGTISYRLTVREDGTYELAVTTNGKSTRSKGRYTLQGNSLSLIASDGDTVNVTILRIGRNHFVFGTNNPQQSQIQFSRV